MLILGRLIRLILIPVAKIFYPCKLVGKEKIPKGGKVVLCANHLHAFDPMYLILYQRRPVYFMAKSELFNNWFNRFFIGSCFGSFSVDYTGKEGNTIDYARMLVNRGEMLGIFPEGTRSKDGKIDRFRSGAALVAVQTEADILPVGIDLPMEGRKLRMFRRATINIGDPITIRELCPNGSAQPDLRYATRLIRERISDLLPPERV